MIDLKSKRRWTFIIPTAPTLDVLAFFLMVVHILSLDRSIIITHSHSVVRMYIPLNSSYIPLHSATYHHGSVSHTRSPPNQIAHEN